MFSLNKTVVCLEFSKTGVFCALAQINGRKVDIIAIDHLKIQSGILEEGIIYDQHHLQEVVKNLITSVSKTHNRIDGAWIAVPDNKVLITKFEVEKNRKEIDERDLHKAIEEKFNFSASKLHLINRQIHEINRKAFFLSNAIRTDHLHPFLQIFNALNIPVDSVFPTFQCIYEELKPQFTGPTLLLSPFEKGFKFFLADSHGVHLESVWGHNVIEFNENFDKAIEEVVQYARQSKEVALGIKNILVIHNNLFDPDRIQSYLQRTGVPFNWVPVGSENESEFDPVAVIILKGLIKSAMSSVASKGFLEPQPIHELERRPLTETLKPNFPQPENTNQESSFAMPFTKNTVVKDASQTEKRWNVKVIAVTVILAVALVLLLSYTGLQVSRRISQGNEEVAIGEETTPTPEETPTDTITPTPTQTPEPTTSPTPSPSPTQTPFTKDEVEVLVLNGNNVTGAASRVNALLIREGFTTKTPGNNDVRNIQSTTVYYKDPRAQELAEEITTILEPTYETAQASLDSTIDEDILVILGIR
ncbi:MAG: LytR C-terminal domain-containing protein [Candidatus Dojkabacteria bacterium]